VDAATIGLAFIPGFFVPSNCFGASNPYGMRSGGVEDENPIPLQFRFGPEDLHGMRVLIVEDDYFLAADLAEALRARGAKVIGPVGTLAEATAAVEGNWIDHAVLDVNLDGEMSFPIADRLEAAGIPYMITTGYSAQSLPERFRTKPRLEKPFATEAVVKLISA
jgi:CheY-like chemotaxis protein